MSPIAAAAIEHFLEYAKTSCPHLRCYQLAGGDRVNLRVKDKRSHACAVISMADGEFQVVYSSPGVPIPPRGETPVTDLLIKIAEPDSLEQVEEFLRKYDQQLL